MTCKGNCGSDRELVELLIKSALADAMANTQGKLKTCAGTDLPAGSKVPTCDELASKIVETVNEKIKDGTIDVVKDVTVTNGKIVVTDGDGTRTEYDLPTPVSTDGDTIYLTDAQGNVHKVPKNALSGNSFNSTITKQGDKYGVDPRAIADGSTIKVNGSNKMYIDPTTLVDNATTEVKNGKIVMKAQKCREITDMNQPFADPGQTCFFGVSTDTKNLPTKLDSTAKTQPAKPTVGAGGGVSEYDFTGWQVRTDGELIQYVQSGEHVWVRSKEMWAEGNDWSDWRSISDDELPNNLASTAELNRLAARVAELENRNRCKTVTDLNDTRLPLGQYCFQGVSTDTKYLPTDINGTTEQVAKPTVGAGVGSEYDFTGWQVASPDEITQYVSNSGVTWVRSHDAAGVREDGTIITQGAWTDWRRLDQPNTTTCKLDCKYLGTNARYTVTNADEFLTIDGGTVTINADQLEVGKVYTIVQTGTKEVTIAKEGNTTLHAPYGGSLKLAGQNASVTVVRELNNNVRVLGQTKPAGS